MSSSRKQVIDASRIAQDLNMSSLRRRSMLNNTLSMISPESRIDINDDEAERRTSRRFETSMSGLESTGGNINEAADSLSSCLKLFTENKINKDNAWTVNIIDTFSKLISKHHECLSNFQVAGTTLEASAKVYGLRVDSVHNDVVRMTSDLGRQSAKSLQRKKNDDDNDSDGGDKENHDNPNDHPNVEQKKKPKKKRNRATVTQNVKTINAKLETNVLTDPFFAKLNSVVGDTNSSKRLMQNIIPTIDSKLKLQQNLPFWNKEDQKFNPKERESFKNFQIKQLIKRNELDRLVLRAGLKKYVLSSNPLEEDDKDNSTKFGDDDFNNTVINNSIHQELQFDINAAVEPVAAESQMIMDFGDMQENDFEDLNEFEEMNIKRCKGLKRQAIVIEDMQPITANNLEYSYRPMESIDRFWAGPSHWKFRQSRRTAMSIGMRASTMPGTDKDGELMPPPKRGQKKRKIPVQNHLTLEDAYDVEEDVAGIMIDIHSKKKTQLSTQLISRKWDPKKLRLPQDHKISSDLYEKFLYMSISSKLKSNNDVPFTDDDDGSHAYNYNNENDRNYCSRLENSDTETETNTDVGNVDFNDYDNEMPPPPCGLDEIPDVFVGAPEKIEKINIAFARRAKVVDMRQLKNCSWSLITGKHQEHPETAPKFSETLKDLPKVLNKQMSDNMSMPLAFYAMLHLCNDKALQLENVNGELDDFSIQIPNVE